MRSTTLILLVLLGLPALADQKPAGEAVPFEPSRWQIRQGRWRRDEDVIFLHTGGAPALFAYQSALST